MIYIFLQVAAERCTFFHHECSGTTCTDGTPHCVLGTCTCTMITGQGIIAATPLPSKKIIIKLPNVDITELLYKTSILIQSYLNVKAYFELKFQRSHCMYIVNDIGDFGDLCV